MRRRLAWAGALAGVLAIGLLLWPDGPALGWAEGATTRSSQQGALADMTKANPEATPPARGGKAASPELRANAMQRLKEAQMRLASYRESTVYPFTARPAREQDDQLYPNRPVTEERPMRDRAGHPDNRLILLTSQNRVFLADGEALVLSVAARDSDGRAVALSNVIAQALLLPEGGGNARATVPVTFAPGGDTPVAEGAWSASLRPAQGPLAGLNGTLRVELSVRAGEREGFHFFDVTLSGAAPADWAGPFKDTLRDGSLALVAPIDVREAGRYLVSARIDDAAGQPVAVLSFNDTLAAGRQEVSLTLFGRLVRDARPSFPLKLRDVEAYLLREQGHPDRALVPRLEGTVLTTQHYALTSFSNEEWQGEQRQRYLDEFGRDVARAQADLAALDAAQQAPLRN